MRRSSGSARGQSAASTACAAASINAASSAETPRFICRRSLSVLGLLERRQRSRRDSPEGNPVKKNVLALSRCVRASIRLRESRPGSRIRALRAGRERPGKRLRRRRRGSRRRIHRVVEPGRMSRLAKRQAPARSGAARPSSRRTKFTNNGSVPRRSGAIQQNGNGGDAGEAAFVPNVFFAMDFDPKWNFGIGVNVPFGLKTEYDSDWIGRFQGIKSEVQTVNINPSVSYKFSRCASLGFGVSWQQGKIDLAYRRSTISGVARRRTRSGPVEGQNATSLDGDAWGFNVGALFDVGAGDAARRSLPLVARATARRATTASAACPRPWRRIPRWQRERRTGTSNSTSRRRRALP